MHRGDESEGTHGVPESDAPAPEPRRIPEATVARLPVYQRILEELVRAGRTTVASEQLAALARVNAAKVRKDLSMLGSFGTRGSGYDARFLVDQIGRALGLDRTWPVAIAGIGNLGRALANSQGFSARGFRVAALVDSDPAVIGESVGGLTVAPPGDLARLAATERLAIGVITTPAEVAQEVADLYIGVGIRSILNFAPRILAVPPDVRIRYVDLSIELQVMSFYEARAEPAVAEGPEAEAEAEADGHGMSGVATPAMPVIGTIGVTPPSHA